MPVVMLSTRLSYLVTSAADKLPGLGKAGLTPELPLVWSISKPAGPPPDGQGHDDSSSSHS